jgi:cytochrome c oxidase subunit 4
MAESESHLEHEAAHHSHLRRYVLVLLALLAGTVITYLAAKVHFSDAVHVTISLVIASTKGALVALFFMHLWDQKGANRLVFGTSLVFVALLVGLTLADNATRFPLANPPGSRGALPGPDYVPPPMGGSTVVR